MNSTRWIATVATIAMLGLLMAACGSSSSTTTTKTPVAATASSAASTASASAATITAAPTAAASSASSVDETCPPASEVNADLAQSNDDPVTTTQQFGISCTYSGGSIVPTKIQFEEDTADTFAAGENSVATTLGQPTIVTGLGSSAYVVSGFLAVLQGSVSVKITSPLSTADQLETLARQIIG